MISTLMLMTALVAGKPSDCEKLKSLKLSNVTITTAEFVPAGAAVAGARGGRGRGQAAGAVPDGGQRGAVRGPAAPITPLPAHCRVAAVLKPSSDSNINIEVWLPTENWNGKFQAIGNGGWAGSIQGINGVGMSSMQTALRSGYATAATDTGHSAADGPSGAFAYNHPEKVVDFGYRAIHEMTVHAKAMIKSFYERAAKYSYFNGCSTGGRQGLMEAQRFPDDFDAILAGAPANNWINLHAADISRMTDIYKDSAGFLSQAKQATLARAVVNACDEIDRIKDNIVSRPLLCKFDPGTLLCKGADNDDCLTAAQVQTAKRVYADTVDSKGQLVFPGFSYGGEAAYAVLRGGTAPGIQLDTFRYLAHQDPRWDWHTFNLETDVALAVKNAGFIDAIDPDLSKFKSHGGKLILYHGWSDQLIPARNTINYHDSVLAKMGRNQDGWLRLFMVPGMFHCGGGPGPSQFDGMVALDAWRDKGRAPAQIIGRNPATDLTRPLCPYPRVAEYRGSDTPVVVARSVSDSGVHTQEEVIDNETDRSNFVCKAPQGGVKSRKHSPPWHRRG